MSYSTSALEQRAVWPLPALDEVFSGAQQVALGLLRAEGDDGWNYYVLHTPDLTTAIGFRISPVGRHQPLTAREPDA